MVPARVDAAEWLKVVAIGVAAFVLLAARFSPNWIAFHRDYRAAVAAAATVQERAAVERVFLGGVAERGYHVLQQARDPRTEISSPVHKIIRWRLLIPGVAHVLRWPDEMVLGAAHVGAFALVIVFAILGYHSLRGTPQAPGHAFAVAMIAGAGAPFFTSMGWLGYYDSWLALALIAAAMAPGRWVVLAACLSAPWIDERFVIGLPLALLVRWGRSDEPPAVWFRREALLPLVVVSVYVAVRLQLGGTGGSHAMGDYAKMFLQRFDISAWQRARGAWEGVHFGWLFIGIAAAQGCFRPGTSWRGQVIVAAVVGATAVVASLTALDLSRSMVVLAPAVAAGAVGIARFGWWRNRWLPFSLAAAALCVPARQVVGVTTLPIEHLFSTRSLAAAQNAVGELYATGQDVPKNTRAAAAWYRKAAELGYPWAQANLGVLYLAGDGLPTDVAQAVEWFRRAAAQGSLKAQNNLGVLYSRGEGIPQDLIAAYGWFWLAAERGDALARQNLQLMQPFLSAEQRARAERLARDFVAANPHARDTTEDETPRLPVAPAKAMPGTP